ncbi:MAG: dockerin type I repeat-containing protein [candidate division Zixibacteria bacterium]|nr:dockerin type I repeat-containing protein [candidate division Zixibacteria bacterium]
MRIRTPVSWMVALLCLLLTTTSFAADTKPLPQTQDQTNSEAIKLTISTDARSPGLSPSAGEQIRWQVIAAGGNRGTSTNFILSGTAGQSAVGKGTSTNFGVNQGFWQNFVATCDDCGDANSDGTIDISDAVFLISYIFSGGAAPGDCRYPNGKGDANGDGTVDISDAVHLISYIFSGGPAPHCQ